jgi:hypothetical protein
MVNYGFSSNYWAISAVVIGFVYLQFTMRSDRNEFRTSRKSDFNEPNNEDAKV